MALSGLVDAGSSSGRHTGSLLDSTPPPLAIEVAPGPRSEPVRLLPKGPLHPLQHRRRVHHPRRDLNKLCPHLRPHHLHGVHLLHLRFLCPGFDLLHPGLFHPTKLFHPVRLFHPAK